tara:strand:+ start:795 stop:1694 length:900 start_codon:yes stop_codon:yes gene_type:complete
VQLWSEKIHVCSSIWVIVIDRESNLRMKTIHRVSFTPELWQLEQLRDLGLEVEGSQSSLVRLVAFDIEESHPAWPEVASLIKDWKMGDVIMMKFTRSELNQARSLRMQSSWHHGYPQPDDDFGYLSTSFDLSEYCENCGIGKRQVAPLQLKQEPRWGRRNILQLHWLYDEFFVLPDVWESVFQTSGVGCLPVIQYKTGQVLQSVVQLDLKVSGKSGLRLSKDQPCETCVSCGRTKYQSICRGLFPALRETPVDSIVKSQEYFGSCASAWNAILVSARLFQKIRAHKLNGVNFIPCDQNM